MLFKCKKPNLSRHYQKDRSLYKDQLDFKQSNKAKLVSIFQRLSHIRLVDPKVGSQHTPRTNFR